MLTILERLPPRLLDTGPTELHGVIPGPTLIHLNGRRPEPLFVSVLLHGDEHTGWLAMREILRRYDGQELPCALTLFIGNVSAAREQVRFLPGQPDYNRVWEIDSIQNPLPEHRMMQAVLEDARSRGVVMAIDVHNNTGINPHYACVRRLDAPTLHLATLFSRTVVYFKKPAGVQNAAFSGLCPSVTIECGRPGEPHGVEHAIDFLDACLHLSALPSHPVAAHDIDLFHSMVIVKVPDTTEIGFGEESVHLRLVDDLDHMNFRELPADTVFGRVSDEQYARLDVRDERGRDAARRYFRCVDGELRTALPVMPSMLTRSVRAIRQDCLCYLMERMHLDSEGGWMLPPIR